MASVQLIPAYDAFLSFLVAKATPQEILAFQIPEELQDRADELADRNKEGLLTQEENFELEQMLEFDELVSLLKAKALKAMRMP